MEKQSKPPESLLSPEALWKLLMQLADPSDLLKSIIDQSTVRQMPAELKPMGDQSIIMLGCTVTIHQHLTITAPPEHDLRAV